MTTKQIIREVTESSMKHLFAAARRTHEDKLNWSPMDLGRTVIDQLAECALMPDFPAHILTHRAMPDLSPQRMVEFRAKKAELTTIDACEEVCRAKTEAFLAVVDAFPDADWMHEVVMPWGEEPWSFLGVARLPSWNSDYHCGQINYIQTLYGDKDMM